MNKLANLTLNKKFYIALAIILLLLWLIYLIFFTKEELVYITTQGQYRDLNQEVYATGILAGQVEVDVGAQVSGQILKLYVKNGDKVKQGQLLCEIDPKIQENELKRALAQEQLIKAQIGAKQAQLAQLLAEYKRQQQLLKSKATSEYEYQSAKASYEVAKYELKTLEAQLLQANLSVSDANTNLGYTKITAPMDGTVYAILVEEGQTVNANQTTPTILRLAKLDIMTVEAEISEADVVKVKEGMEASFTILGIRNKSFKGTLKSIDPAPASAATTSENSSNSTTTNAVYYNALLDVDNSDGILRIDMTANVTIVTQARQNVLSIPLNALQNDDYVSKAQVKVLRDNNINLVDVTTGIRDSYFVEIKSGLSDKDIIVIGEDVATQEAKALKNATTGKRPRGI